MLTMKTILHPTDFSAGARAAFEVACALAGEGDGRVVVVHVERPPLATLGGSASVRPLPIEYGRERFWEELKAIQPARGGITAEHRLEFGEPAAVILKVAQEIGANLIVMGTHGRTGLRHLLMGSVAERVVRKASCPVLTVRTTVQTLSSLPFVSGEASELELTLKREGNQSIREPAPPRTWELEFSSVTPDLETLP